MTTEDQKDESQATSEQPSEERRAPDPREMYYVHNVTRGRHNRTLRALQPKHHGMKQFLGGGKYRSIRGRPIALTREQVGEHIEELVKKVDAGMFELRTHDGRIVDVRTGDAAPRNASAALPRFALDSIANDQQNVGEKMPQYAGGDVEGTAGSEPALLSEAEGEDEPPPVTPPAPPAVTEISPEVPPPPPDATPEETATEEKPSEDPASDETPDLVGGEDAPEESATTETTASKPAKAEKKKGNR